MKRDVCMDEVIGCAGWEGDGQRALTTRSLFQGGSVYASHVFWIPHTEFVCMARTSGEFHGEIVQTVAPRFRDHSQSLAAISQGRELRHDRKAKIVPYAHSQRVSAGQDREVNRSVLINGVLVRVNRERVAIQFSRRSRS